MADAYGALFANPNRVQSVIRRVTRDGAANRGRANIDGADNVTATNSCPVPTFAVYPSHMFMPYCLGAFLVVGDEGWRALGRTHDESVGNAQIKRGNFARQ